MRFAPIVPKYLTQYRHGMHPPLLLLTELPVTQGIILRRGSRHTNRVRFGHLLPTTSQQVHMLLRPERARHDSRHTTKQR